MDIHEKRRAVRQCEAKIRRLDQEIAAAEAACTHEWGPAEYVPDRLPNGQPDAANHEIPCWRQICAQCGMVRYATRTKPVAPVPDFN